MLLRDADPPVAQRPPAAHQRTLDNPRIVIAAVVILLALLGALVWLSERAGTAEIVSPALSGVLSYVLSAVDLSFLAALLFVLARNLLKLWVEQRRAVPFARFRAKLVAALLAMTIVPAVLVLITGSQIISSSTARWLSSPVEQVLQSANTIASRSLEEHRVSVSTRARRLASTLPASSLSAADLSIIQPLLRADLATLQQGKIDCYRATAAAVEPSEVTFVAGGDAGALTRDPVQASADRLARQAVTTGKEATNLDELNSGGLLVRSAWPVQDGGAIVGAVVVSELINADITAQMRNATAEYEKYLAIKTLKRPLQGVYLALFLMVTLLILVSATWFGLYLAKRITRPVQMLAEGARAIGAGQLDLRLEAETSDELGSLVEAFNMMAAELGTSKQKLEQSRLALEHKNAEVDARRRYIETILERVATGVISIDADGCIQTVNGASSRLLGLDETAVGRSALEVFSRDDLQPLRPLVESTRGSVAGGVVQEITLARDDREIHLAAAGTVLTSDDGTAEGVVLVLDDVTPLIRAQRVAAWRDVARRLAHEIKNPLTPIQLSAERLRKNFANAPPNARALVDECTGAIVTEVEALKSLVDEFAQFARLRGPRTVPADLNRLIAETLQLYAGVLQQGSLRVRHAGAPDLPLVRIDPEQIRQVIINLVDNGMEALGGPNAPARPDGRPAEVVLATTHDAPNGIVRLTVADNGPGVPPADRDKLFMPYYSTKGRGSGLGLAIVRRIVAEHGGAIEVDDAKPHGTVFAVELPAV